MRPEAPKMPERSGCASAPAWLGLPACVAMAAGVALLGLAGLKLVPLSGPDARAQAYLEWLGQLRALEQACGRDYWNNVECWKRHPLPPEPSH